MVLRSRLGKSTDRFSVPCVLQPEIKANLPLGFRAKHRVRAYNHEVRPDVLADSRQALTAQAVQVRQRKFHLYARNDLSGNRADVLACCEFGGEPIGKSRRQPGLLGISGEISESQNR